MAKRGNKPASKPQSQDVVSNDEAEALVKSGAAEVPSEAIISAETGSSSQADDLASHPKFAKFKRGEK